MTKSKIKGDICAIECSADGCEIYFEHTDAPYAEVQLSRGINAWVRKDGAKLCIKHKKGIISKLFGGAYVAKIYIPGHIVPSVDITGGEARCKFKGGIYGDINFSAAGGNISADAVAANELTVNASACNLRLCDCTIKGSVAAATECGDVSFERTFATHICCRTKKGNIGGVELNCRDTILEAGEGNIAVTVRGDESAFDVILTAKEGTCNRESINIENNSASFKAYAEKGNIFVDFIPDEEE